jgi:hypothetical protein
MAGGGGCMGCAQLLQLPGNLNFWSKNMWLEEPLRVTYQLFDTAISIFKKKILFGI